MILPREGVFNSLDIQITRKIICNIEMVLNFDFRRIKGFILNGLKSPPFSYSQFVKTK